MRHLAVSGDGFHVATPGRSVVADAFRRTPRFGLHSWKLGHQWHCGCLIKGSVRIASKWLSLQATRYRPCVSAASPNRPSHSEPTSHGMENQHCVSAGKTCCTEWSEGHIPDFRKNVQLGHCCEISVTPRLASHVPFQRDPQVRRHCEMDRSASHSTVPTDPQVAGCVPQRWICFTLKGGL